MSGPRRRNWYKCARLLSYIYHAAPPRVTVTQYHDSSLLVILTIGSDCRRVSIYTGQYSFRLSFDYTYLNRRQHLHILYILARLYIGHVLGS